MSQALNHIKQTTRRGVHRVAGHVGHPRDIRVGVELKFPTVTAEGRAASREQVTAMFEHLTEGGWSPMMEDGVLIGATQPGEQNDTAASCETGYCKAEFSLAHTADLHAMAAQIEGLRSTLRPYGDANDFALLGCGIHPVTQPSGALKVNQQRAGVWGRVFRSNTTIHPDEGDDVDLFTVNTANHVHVGVPEADAAAVINALNGYAPAQIALGANAKVWRNAVDDGHASVAEAFWDWWEPAAGRVGMSPRPFDDLDSYLDHVTGLPCLYVKRDDGPIALDEPTGLGDFFDQPRVAGTDLHGQAVRISPQAEDIALHNSCYWYNARLSRYYTVENRVFDQQPPTALLAPAAITLGLAAAAQEANEALSAYAWDQLRDARVSAYRHGLNRNGSALDPAALAAEALDLAEVGLRRRGLGEDVYLHPFYQRLATRRCPAEDAADIFRIAGAPGLVAHRRWA